MISNKGQLPYKDISEVGVVDNMIGFWKFNDNVLDYSGKNHHMSVVGSIKVVPGKKKSALSLNNSSFEDTFILNNFDYGIINKGMESKEWSISLWVNINGSLESENNDNIIFGKDINNSGILLYEGVNGKRIMFHIRDKNGWASSSMRPYYDNVELNTWYHVVATYNNRTMKLYINGEFVDSEVFNGEMPEHPNTWYISNKKLGLSIQDLRVYDKELQESDINILYKIKQNKIPVQVAKNTLYLSGEIIEN